MQIEKDTLKTVQIISDMEVISDPFWPNGFVFSSVLCVLLKCKTLRVLLASTLTCCIGLGQVHHAFAVFPKQICRYDSLCLIPQYYIRLNATKVPLAGWLAGCPVECLGESGRI